MLLENTSTYYNICNCMDYTPISGIHIENRGVLERDMLS